MKFLVVGLGSMGKRRVRNLQAIGGHEIAGFDIQTERCDEAKEKYGITTFNSFEQAVEAFQPDGLVISTSPDRHMQYANWAYDNNKCAFIEASVTDAEDIKALGEKVAADNSRVIVPSCTMRFFAGPKLIKKLLAEEVIGEPLYLNYHTGQYLPDWHPWEPIQSYYVSKRETGAAREIVPFELTWLNDLFGDPEVVTGWKAKLTDMDADIDDIYQCVLKYPGKLTANVTVDVVSRPEALREFRLMGSKGTIVFSADENKVRWMSVGDEKWHEVDLAAGSVESGYINPEEPYIEELGSYVEAAKAKNAELYPNDLLTDYRVLQVLYGVEKFIEG